jgi:DNA repair protein RecO (recombination protein O)
MDWTDVGVVLSSRPYGENNALAVLLTRAHGRCAGMLPGGQGMRRRALVEPGTVVHAHWRGRTAEQLGTWGLEAENGVAARFLHDPGRLAALASACALCDVCLPDREPHPALHDGLLALFDLLDGPVWAEACVRWEVGLLAELGFALDLSACAVTGADAANDYLSHVSPRSGRAVSASAAEPYLDKLLPLPGFLVGRGVGGADEAAAGLRLTGYFLERCALHGPLPPARVRLAEICDRAAGAAV